MTLTRLTLCALVLLALPTFAAGTDLLPATGDLPVAGPLANEAPADGHFGCSGSLSTVEPSEAEPIQLWLGSAAELLASAIDPTPAPQVTGFSCGGPFPVNQPGACNQTCAPCYRNSDCPVVVGRPQKCCTYCP